MRLRVICLTLASGSILAMCASGAFAQNNRDTSTAAPTQNAVPESPATGTEASAVPGGNSSGSAPAAGVLAHDTSNPGGSSGDIIVTARRRAERLQDVPLTVQAFGEQTLARRGITRTDDLRQTVPSLSIQPAAQGRRDTPTFEIRGIQSGEATISQDTAVALYFDDVYQARPTGVNQQLYDLENVQVLSGPQGTLFGRNSTAGAILFTSKRPTDKFEGEVSFTGGNYDRREFRGIVNVPLTDTLKIRVSAQRLLRDGYTNDPAQNENLDNANVYTGRGSILWEPSSRLSNLTIFDYFHSHDNGGNNILYAVRACAPKAGLPFPFNYLAGSPSVGCLYGPVGNAVLGTENIFQALANQQAAGIRTENTNIPLYAKSTAWGVSNTTTFKINDELTLKNIFGHRYSFYQAAVDLDGTSVDISHNPDNSQRANTFSDELQLQGNFLDGNLTTVAGLFYFHEKGDEFENSYILEAVNAVNNPNTHEAEGINVSKSVYAQATYKFPFFPKVSVTAGGRYTWDSRTLDELPTSLAGVAQQCYYTDANGAPLNPCYRHLHLGNSEPTYTFSVDYKPSRDVLLYVTTRRGYRSGGFNFRGNTPLQSQPFQPETVKDVEGGIKADWHLGGGMTLRTNLDGYSIWYDNIQESVAVLSSGGAVSAVLTNAAQARVNGAEATLNFSPVRGFDIGGYFGYVDGKFTNFDTVVNGVETDVKNTPFPASKYTYGVNFTATPIDDPARDGTVTITANWSFRSTFYGPNSLPDIEPESRVPGQGLMNLSLDWSHIAGSRFSGQVFVRNALNEKYVIGEISLQDILGLTSRSYGEPRMVGATLKYNW